MRFVGNHPAKNRRAKQQGVPPAAHAPGGPGRRNPGLLRGEGGPGSLVTGWVRGIVGGATPPGAKSTSPSSKAFRLLPYASRKAASACSLGYASACGDTQGSGQGGAGVQPTCLCADAERTPRQRQANAHAQRGSANQHADYDINPAECHGRGLPPARNRDWRHHNGKRYVGALRRFGLEEVAS